jgi:hypothetical protein
MNDNMEIKSRVVKTEPTDWRKFKFLQSDRFKTFPPELKKRLRESIIRNHFLETFKVWENGKDIYCLDGYHRCLILRELEAAGYNVPAKLPAEFIECANKKEASKLVLLYSSAYADVNRSGFMDYMAEFDLDVDELMDEINLTFNEKKLVDDEDEGFAKDELGEYPITPRFSERYDYVLIFCKNEIDFTHLADTLKLRHEKGYKSTMFGLGRVIPYDRFMELWNTRDKG